MPTYSILESQNENISELISDLSFSTLNRLNGEGAGEMELELREEIEEMELKLEDEIEKMELELGEEADEQQLMSYTTINSLDETSDILADIEFDEDCELGEGSSNDRSIPEIASVSCYDELMQEMFTLRVHIVSVSGDIPALSKVMCVSGHNAYSGCRYCYFSGMYSEKSRHVYFPLSPPRGYKDITKTECKSKNDRHKIEHETGVNGHSILFELSSIDFPASFLVDIMYALFENVAQHMLCHFIGKFYNNENLNNTEYKISTHNWDKIRKIIENNRKMMLLEFGRPLINI
ncbi:413_t:CDS:2 [Racocetra fulgida]|uniref:413_t:CDS:1 n=1 Tax=Racocetra fulgida TaxID=60492 RepID=A0A9N8W7Y3_9GLOM|nr:413_t:CDS:2 [Racocetra fulgida]